MQRSWFLSRTRTVGVASSCAGIATTLAGAGDPVAWHAAETVARMPDVHGPRALAVADLDADRDLDIVVASEHAPALAWLVNTGGPESEWPVRPIHDGEGTATSVLVTDVDGDGMPDLVAALNGVCWFRNEGKASSWTPQVIVDRPDGDVTSLAVADMDGDGDMDIISASARARSIHWHRNDGAGDPEMTWPTERVAADAADVTMLSALDFDGDRTIDLLAAEAGTDRVRLFTNSGDGAEWEPTVVLGSIEGARSAWAMDVNGDGTMNIITAARRGHAIAWHALSEEGAFTAHPIFANAQAPWTVTPIDLDGDGDMDFVAGIDDALRPASGSTLRWFENDGTGQPAFVMHAIPDVVPATSAVQAIAAADIDGDGAMDVITAWKVGNVVTRHRAKTSATRAPATRTVQEPSEP